MLRSLVNLIYPKLCYGCGTSISSSTLEHICLTCRSEFNRIHNNPEVMNLLQQNFSGRLKTNKVCSYLKFEKNARVERAMYALKYKGIKEVGITLGEMAALEIGTTSFFDDIDLLVPVPIHYKKARRRGYNQSDYIAEGIRNITELSVSKNEIIKQVHTASQTRKNRFDRHLNADRTFKIKKEEVFKNKHLLIIDDVLTTGSTIEACGTELLKIKGVQLSVLTIAFTY